MLKNFNMLLAKLMWDERIIVLEKNNSADRLCIVESILYGKSNIWVGICLSKSQVTQCRLIRRPCVSFYTFKPARICLLHRTYLTLSKHFSTIQ